MNLYRGLVFKVLVLGRLPRPLRMPVPMRARSHAMRGCNKANPERDSFMFDNWLVAAKLFSDTAFASFAVASSYVMRPERVKLG